ncbi:MAG: NAD-dependent epimerase/dehydratase family protein [Lachnospiraceae bacterium]
MKQIIENDAKIIYSNYCDIIYKLKDTNILITGACGMITSYLSMILLSYSQELNINLYLQCRNAKKARYIFKDFLENPTIHIVDFSIECPISDEVHYDYIIHGASPAGTDHFINNPVGVISPNVIGTKNLLDYGVRNNIKKLIFLSSNSIYGVSDKAVLSENDYGYVDPLGVRACYIEAKRLGEQLCTAYLRQFNINTGIIRICHTYGPTFDISNDTRAIPRFLRDIVDGKDIVIYHDPNSLIQYTYVADIVTGILCIMINGKNGEAYNGCGDTITTMDKVINYMINVNDNIKSRLIEKPIDDNYRFGDNKGINFSKMDNTKLKNIGWKQLFSIEDGLYRTVNSYFL